MKMRCKKCGHVAEVSGPIVSQHDADILVEFADLLSARSKTHTLDGKCMHEFETLDGVGS